MSRKSEQVAALVQRFAGRGKDPHYLGYFELFNEGLYYEAHEVLEHLWLPQRRQANGAFYKGLIQLAGAFVHLQKGRLRPAAALFRLAKNNFDIYPRIYEDFSLPEAETLIFRYLDALEAGRYGINPLSPTNAPKLSPLSSDPSRAFRSSSRPGNGGG